MTTVSSDADNDTPGRISQLEKQLKVQLKEKRAFHPDVRNLRGKLREKYVEIILTEPELAERYDTAASLWHLVYYVMIEEFRNRIRYAASNPGVKDANQRVQRLLTEFRTFIGDATKFYSGLILKLKKKYGLRLEEGSEFQSQPDEVKQLREFKRTCHRFYIQLGDLARYKEAHSDAQKDWSTSAGYYFKAMALWPAAGHPHNQLAVVATYMQNEFLAVYHYFRSLGVEDPFITARGNLVLLFEKNRQQYSEIAEQKRPQRKGKEPPKQDSKESEQDTRRNFFVRFVRLHGILFTKTSLETFSDVYQEMVRDLERLLSPNGPSLESVFSSELRRAEDASKGLALGVLQLISILIFSVPNGNSRTSYADVLQHTTISNYALTAAFRVAGCFMASCSKSNDVTESPLLPASLVFIEWLASRQDLASGASGEDEKLSKARKGFWRDCLALLNKICDCDSDETSGTPDAALWEDHELAGFTPLSPAHLGLDFDRKNSNEFATRRIRFIAAGKSLAGSNTGFAFDEELWRFYMAGEKRTKERIPLPKSPVSEAVDPAPKPRAEPQVIPPPAASPVAASAGAPVEEDEEEEVIVFKPVVKAPDSKPAEETTPAMIKENGAGAGVYKAPSDIYSSLPSLGKNDLYSLLGTPVLKPGSPVQNEPATVDLSSLNSELYGSQYRVPTPSSIYQNSEYGSLNSIPYSSMGLPVDVDLNRPFISLGMPPEPPPSFSSGFTPGFTSGFGSGFGYTGKPPGITGNGHLNDLGHLNELPGLGGLQQGKPAGIETGGSSSFATAQELLLKLQSSLATARELQRERSAPVERMKTPPPPAAPPAAGKLSGMRPPPGFGPIPQRAPSSQKLASAAHSTTSTLVDKEQLLASNSNVSSWMESSFNGGRAAGQPLYGGSYGIWSNSSSNNTNIINNSSNGGVPSAAYPFPGMGIHTLQQIEQQMPTGAEQPYYGSWKGEPSSSPLSFEQSQQGSQHPQQGSQQPMFRPYRPQDPFVS